MAATLADDHQRGNDMDTTYDSRTAETRSPWGAVICMSLMTFMLVASEFMPVSLLTPIADGPGDHRGTGRKAIAVSGFFAVVTSLFGNALLSRLDRRTVVLGYTAVLVISGIAVTFAPNYLIFMIGRALIGVSVGGFWSLSTAIVARIVAGPTCPRRWPCCRAEPRSPPSSPRRWAAFSAA